MEIYFPHQEHNTFRGFVNGKKEYLQLPVLVKSLNEKQIAVVDYIARGYTYDEIADELSVTRRCVDQRLDRIKSKLDLVSRWDIVKTCVEHNVIDLNEVTRDFDLRLVWGLPNHAIKKLKILAESVGAVNMNKYIADKLHILPVSVSRSMEDIYFKLGVRNHIQAGLVYKAAVNELDKQVSVLA